MGIIVGDALGMMRGMEGSSIDCVVTSPPYWGLRDYGVEGQTGLESTIGLYTDHLVEIFDEVRSQVRRDRVEWRVRKDGGGEDREGRRASRFFYICIGRRKVKMDTATEGEGRRFSDDIQSTNNKVTIQKVENGYIAWRSGERLNFRLAESINVFSSIEDACHFLRRVFE
jgi:hypothetical protein